MVKGGNDMANYTQHYQLHQWESTDDFLRTDFNTDLEKIDTALGQNCRVIHGSYTGNGEASQFIALEETPNTVAVFQSGILNLGNILNGGFAFPGASCTTVSVGDNGFTVMNSDSRATANASGSKYEYMAFFWSK